MIARCFASSGEVGDVLLHNSPLRSVLTDTTHLLEQWLLATHKTCIISLTNTKTSLAQSSLACNIVILLEWTFLFICCRQFSSLWQIGDKVETMNEGVDTHLNSLQHYGCSNYIKAGKLSGFIHPTG